MSSLLMSLGTYKLDFATHHFCTMHVELGASEWQPKIAMSEQGAS